MMKAAELRAFMQRYFPTFLLGFFTCVLSTALSLVLWIDSHWRNHPDNSTYTLLCSAGLVLLLCVGHFAMIRGIRWAMWLVLPVPAAALLMALSLFGSGLPAALLAIVLALPLVALLVFNSRRYREMQQVLAQHRERRRAMRG